jgi:hypothetical protein
MKEILLGCIGSGIQRCFLQTPKGLPVPLEKCVKKLVLAVRAAETEQKGVVLHTAYK